MADLDPVELLALSKAVKSKAVEAARRELGPGVHHVDCTVRVRGSLEIGEDGERSPTASIPVKEVLALFVARSGANRGAALKLLRTCLRDALSKGPSAQGAITMAADIDRIFEAEVAELVKGLPPTPVRGSVRVAVEVTRCGKVAAPAAD